MITDAIKRARRADGLTQADLADLAGVAERSVWMLEQGRGNLASLLAVQTALGLSLRCPGMPREKSLQDLLGALRERSGLSLAELSRRCNLAPATIRTLGQGGSGRVDVLLKILGEIGPEVVLEKASKRSHYQATSRSDRHDTPEDLLNALYQVFDFDLDPCSPRKDGPVKARKHYTIEDDGLVQEWHGVVYANPPYGRPLPKWIRKARDEFDAGRARCVVLLIPAATGTLYWHDLILRPDSTIFYLRGRLRYGGAKHRAPFPSALIVWGASAKETKSLNTLMSAKSREQ